MNIVPILKAEIAALEADLANDPRQRKLARLRATLAEYEPIEQVRADHVNGAGVTPKRKAPTSAPRNKPRNKKDRIKDELIALFEKHGSVHRTSIINHLIAQNLMGHEKDPLAALASYLSGWRDDFAFDGKGNWSLRQVNPASPLSSKEETGAVGGPRLS